MVAIFFQQIDEFICPKTDETRVGHRPGQHQPGPGTFIADADAVAIGGIHPGLVVGCGMCSGDFDVPLLHELEEVVGDGGAVGFQGKGCLIGAAKPVLPAV